MNVHWKATLKAQNMFSWWQWNTVLSVCDVLVNTSPSTSPTTAAAAAANEPVDSVTTEHSQQSSADKADQLKELNQLIDNKLLELENCL